jgi:hypothetical protein
VTVRPLCVDELAEVLAVDLSAGSVPRFNPDWRWADREEAVLTGRRGRASSQTTPTTRLRAGGGVEGGVAAVCSRIHPPLTRLRARGSRGGVAGGRRRKQPPPRACGREGVAGGRVLSQTPPTMR